MKERKFLQSRLPSSACTNCGQQIDAATSVDGRARPKPGNITVCLYCGHLMAFTRRLRLRDLTDDEMQSAAGNEIILRIQRARGEAMLKGSPWPPNTRSTKR